MPVHTYSTYPNSAPNNDVNVHMPSTFTASVNLLVMFLGYLHLDMARNGRKKNKANDRRLYIV